MMADHKLFPSLPFYTFFFFLLYNPMLVLGHYYGGQGRGHGVTSPARLQTYIVHVQQPDAAAFASSEERDSWYKSFVSSVLGGFEEPRWVYSYHEVVSGFAVRLAEEELAALQKKEGFLHAYPDAVVPLAITHSPEFLGLRLGRGLWGGATASSGLGEGIIVGMLDTGITPGHPSFDDEGMQPPPSRWKGSCEQPEFCNNKIIGARTFGAIGDATPSDEVGHGTHTASTATGSFVKGASVLGSANGTAVGMAPRAHLAIYKVCNEVGCQSSGILAGMDAAVGDGVNVLSLSLGGRSSPFHIDPIAIGAFGAVRKGVFVSCAGGNEGPTESTIANDAPWILTVAASTMDRSIVASVRLGDGQQFLGQSAFQPGNFTRDALPLVFPGGDLHDTRMPFCDEESLDGADVKGKVVLCQWGGGIPSTDKGANVLNAGGAAMIVMNQKPDANTTEAAAHVLPASQVSYASGSRITDYIKATTHPRASIAFEGTKIGTSASSPAPAVASFSSRGPSVVAPGVLKPDIAGPGVSVLAAWPSSVGRARATSGAGGASFNMISGTSMATPHLSGVAALLKSAHPDWSPAAIKSAIMTTADVRGNDGEPIKDERTLRATVFAIGAGHVNATRAADPGLVYDLGTDDHVAYICGLGYTDGQVSAIVGRQRACSNVTRITGRELNYPSISVTLWSASSPTVGVERTVTNVGEAGETYTVEVEGLAGVGVSVRPRALRFSEVKEKQSYTVSFTAQGGARGFLEGSLRWVSAKHAVRSPVSIAIK